MSDINKLQRWLKEFDFVIKFHRNAEDCIDFKDKTIMIKSTQTEASQISAILHECGHLIFRAKQDFNKIYPTINKTNRKKSLRSTIETLTDETISWYMAETLRHELKLKVPIDKFRRQRDLSLKTYINQ